MGGETMTELPSGIRIRGNSIQIDFYYKGARCREVLKLKPNVKNIKYASKLRDTILFEIERNQFDYVKYFPESRKLLIKQEVLEISFLSIIEKQMELYRRRYNNGKMSISTLKGYEKIIKSHIIPTFGHLNLSQISSILIREWLYSFTRHSKTIINILIPLRTMLNNAVKDGCITENPLDKVDISSIIVDIGLPKVDMINPFTLSEIETLINATTGQFKNLIQFSFWSGLRTGELLALRWSDILFNEKLIKVSRSIVHGEEKAPKTKSGIRSVLMLPKAEEALKDQFKYTGIEFDFVFHNPNTNKAWSSNGKVGDTWRKLLSTLDIKYRNCYQMRHTYASMLLSNGENPAWIATQLGHVDVEMVFKVYGKWIPNNKEMGGYKLRGIY